MIVDPWEIWQDPMPPQWEISRDILDKFAPPRRFWTKEEHELADIIRANRWFLVRNEITRLCVGVDRKSGCGQLHRYITKYCIDLPFNALQQLQIQKSHPTVDKGSIHGMRVLVEEQSTNAWLVGEPEPITAEEARRLLRRIREKEKSQKIAALLRR